MYRQASGDAGAQNSPQPVQADARSAVTRAWRERGRTVGLEAVDLPQQVSTLFRQLVKTLVQGGTAGVQELALVLPVRGQGLERGLIEGNQMPTTRAGAAFAQNANAGEAEGPSSKGSGAVVVWPLTPAGDKRLLRQFFVQPRVSYQCAKKACDQTLGGMPQAQELFISGIHRTCIPP